MYTRLCVRVRCMRECMRAYVRDCACTHAPAYNYRPTRLRSLIATSVEGHSHRVATRKREKSSRNRLASDRTIPRVLRIRVAY